MEFEELMGTVKYEIFQGSFATWDELFTRAARFATELGELRVINISHSDNGNGVVTVWYWSGESE